MCLKTSTAQREALKHGQDIGEYASIFGAAVCMFVCVCVCMCLCVCVRLSVCVCFLHGFVFWNRTPNHAGNINSETKPTPNLRMCVYVCVYVCVCVYHCVSLCITVQRESATIIKQSLA